MKQCVLAPRWGRRDRLGHAALHLLIPAARAFVRHAPFERAKQRAWDRLVEPYLAWHSHKFVARTGFGASIAGDTSEVLQQYVYYFGVWEPELTAWISRRLKPGDTFVDVGANVGYFTLLASTLVGASGAVVAVEPSPTLFFRLGENLGRNRAGNVRTVNLAASGAPTRVTIFRGPASHTGLTTILPQPGLAVEGEVEARPLDALLRPDEVRHARLVKIDVEGAEDGVVKGMEALLAGGRPDLEVIVEIHPVALAQLDKTPEDVLGTLLDAGFRPYVLENDYEPPALMRARRVPRPKHLDGPVPRGCETNVLFTREEIGE